MAERGVALREMLMAPDFGPVDYLLYANWKVSSFVEAKKKGKTLTGVVMQAEKYGVALPAVLPTYFWPRTLIWKPMSNGLGECAAGRH